MLEQLGVALAAHSEDGRNDGPSLKSLEVDVRRVTGEKCRLALALMHKRALLASVLSATPF